MLPYKNYSFDLWLTLIKSNPLFKKRRSEFFFKELNFNNNSFEKIEETFRKVDLMCNSINQKVGKNIDALEMYLMVLYLLSSDDNCFENINVEEIYQEVEEILFENLPVIYSDHCFQVLDILKDQGAMINILSNTGFIKGRSLRKVLHKIGLDSYFDFQIYSDEFGLSKPTKEIFQHLIKNIEEYRKAEPVSLKDIVHIGDNPVADFNGALSIGIGALLINSNNRSILSLLN